MGKRLSREEVVAIGVLIEKGQRNCEIARALDVTEGAVRYQRKRLGASGEDGRKQKVCKAEQLVEPIDHWVETHEVTAGQRPVNVQDLFDHLVSEHGYTGSYKSVLRYVRRRYGRPRLRTYRRVETPPGAQTQTDWAECPRVDVGRGEGPLHGFVMVLSHSRMPAVIWSWREDQVSWLHCHNGAYRRLGGIGAVNRIDNVRTAIVVGAGAWGVINQNYRAYARAVGFHIDACGPRQPNAKGKVEAKVRLSRLRVDPSGRIHESLEELQERTDEALLAWSKKAICPATGLCVYESWQRELDKLRPLPILPEPFDVVVSRWVGRDCLVPFEGRHYTVPFRYAGQRVEVHGCAGRVQIFADGAVIREYPRGTAERILIDPSCYEGEATDQVQPPPPLGKMGRRLQEIYEMPVELRPLDLYAALAEVAR